MTEDVAKEEVSFRKVLQNRDFVKLLSGQFFSNFADNVFRVIILLHIYSLTGDLSLTTLVLGAQIAPWIIVGPIAGVMADRLSRKAIMVASDIIRTACLIIFPFLTDINLILLVTFIIGTAASAFAAPRAAAIPEITGMKLYVKAITLSQLIFQTMAILGPLLGAIIYVVLGGTTFLFGSLCYGLSAAILYFTLIPSANRNADEVLSLKVVLRDLKEGIVYLFTETTIMKILLLFTVIIIGAAFAGTLIYPYLYEILHDGLEENEDLAQREFGLIGAITAFGSILGNLTFGRFERRIGRPTAIFVGTIGLGVYYFIFIVTPSFRLIAAVAITFGFCNGMAMLAVNAIFAETVPNEIRGRAYSATNAYIQVFSVVSIIMSGILAEIFGIINAIVGAGVFIIVSIFIFTVTTKYFRFVDQAILEQAIPLSAD
ncbi:MAG: MFS transporter [Candidatus Kariarchaeaceae archaeon]|jgi:MFS family permease